MKTLALCALIFGFSLGHLVAELPRGGKEILPNGVVIIRSGDKVEIKDEAKRLLQEHKFDSLTGLVKTYRENKSTHSDGTWHLNSFYDAFSFFKTEQEWTEVFDGLRAWSAHELNDPAPLLALAHAHWGYGKTARGGGFSNTVSEDGWNTLGKELATARSILSTNAARCAKCPFYFVVQMKIGIDGSEPRESFIRHFTDGIALEPGFLQLYEMKSYYLLPRWYGREGEIKEYVRDLLDNHPVAALWVLWQFHRYDTYENMFEEEDLPWESVNGKLRQSLVGGTGPGKPNMLAYLADIAGDQDMVREITTKEGFEFDVSKWRTEGRAREVASQSLPQEYQSIPELVPLLEAYESRAKALAHEPHGVAFRDLNAKYLAALEKALESAKKDARLEDATEITAERDALVLGDWPPKSDPATLAPALGKLRRTYLTALAGLERARDQKLALPNQEFSRALDTLVASLTREGRMEEAVEVKKRQEELGSTKTVGGKPDPQKPLTPLGNSAGRVSIPKDAKQHAGSHFKVILVEEAVTWEEARKLCQDEGGELGWFDSPSEESFIKDLMSEVVAAKGHKPIWVGGQVDKDGDWAWINGKKVDPAFWVEANERIPNPGKSVMMRWIGSFKQSNGTESRIAGYLCRWD